MRDRSILNALRLVAMAMAVVVGVAGCGGATERTFGSLPASSSVTSAGSSGTLGEESRMPTEVTSGAFQEPPTAARPLVTVTVVYDNTAAIPGTRADWGFSCLVQGFDKTVLFDTGARGDILLYNMEVLGITPEEIDVVVFSHDHSDHIGGLAQVIALNPNVTVYYPATFSQDSVRSARDAGASLVPVDTAISPCSGMTVMAPIGRPQESGLLLETSVGQVLMLGCAHPGVVEMVKAANKLAGGPVVAVLGGFHLMSYSSEHVDGIAEELRAVGVERCGPAHCTGEKAIAQLTGFFSSGAIAMGVGAVATF